MILAIEASGARSSLALLAGEGLREVQFESRQRLSQELVPRIHRLVAEAMHPLNEIEKIAVSIGPGSFTSLRIGVTTAKTLAHALGCPVVGIGTLDLLALSTTPLALAAGAKTLCVAVEARRLEAYAALFRVPGGPIAPAVPVLLQDLLAFCRQGEVPVALCGIPFRSPEIQERLVAQAAGLCEWLRLDAECDRPSAARLARAARDMAGVEPDAINPIYLHPSQAEAALGEGPARWLPQ